MHNLERESDMAAPKKISPEMEKAIVRRRRAGEGIQAIARDFGIAHQTVSKLAKQHSDENAPDLQRQGKLVSSGQLAATAVASRAGSLGQGLLPNIFASCEERFWYYETASWNPSATGSTTKTPPTAAKHRPSAVLAHRAPRLDRPAER
jgi:transposase-like protein